ncbi:hypothetical protein CEXT_522561 [Caerostris extrusa]|uniref:Uncharacterized protein n=1 Tax=Caerostris extrusa TaxID=172846 RepID=A0AAV4MR78_CAEEX|nr:hypothetical protein CEXT_522561 [Caerostris extrusa]
MEIDFLQLPLSIPFNLRRSLFSPLPHPHPLGFLQPHSTPGNLFFPIELLNVSFVLSSFFTPVGTDCAGMGFNIFRRVGRLKRFSMASEVLAQSSITACTRIEKSPQ